MKRLIVVCALLWLAVLIGTVLYDVATGQVVGVEFVVGVGFGMAVALGLMAGRRQ